jgi:VanZ family protein
VVNRRNRALIRALAPIALMGAIFYFSSQHAGEHLAWWEVVLRKMGHITGYALLTALWAWALSGVVRRPILVAALIALAYACTDEFHQHFVATRHGTPVDVGVDSIGILIAAALLHVRQRRPERGSDVDARGGVVARSSLARSP